MSDPTYVKTDIEANPVWALAFRLSEWDNDSAPIGWGQYLPCAEWAIATQQPTDDPLRLLAVFREGGYE